MAKFLEILDKHLGMDSSAIQSKIAERENKINTIISEAFVGKYPTKELAANRITNEFALELCVSEDLDMNFLRENKEILVDKVKSLTEGEIKIIINNDVNRGKGGAVASVVGDLPLEMEAKTPKKRGRPPKVAVEPPKQEVVIEEEEIEMPEQTAQLIADKAVEFGLNKEETINLVKNMFTNNELAPKIIDSEFVGENLDEITDILDGMDDVEFAGDMGSEETEEVSDEESEEESEDLPDEESEDEESEDEESEDEESEDEESEDEDEVKEGKTSLRFNKRGFFGPINESQKFLMGRGFLTEGDDGQINADSDQRQNVAESDDESDEELDENISPTWEIILKNGMKMVIKAKEILSDIGATDLHLPGGNTIQLPSPIKGIEPVYSEGADNDDHNLNLEVNECDDKEAVEGKSKFAKYATESLKKMGEPIEEEDEIEFDIGEDGEGESSGEETEEDGTEEHEEAETPEEEEVEHAEGGEEEGVEDEESEEETEEEYEEPESDEKMTISPDSVQVEKDGEGVKISLKFSDIKDLIANFDNEEPEEETEDESEEEESEEESEESGEGEESEEVNLFADDEDEIEEPEESEQSEEEEESEEEESEEETEEEEESEEESEEEEEESEEEEEEEVQEESVDLSKKKKTTYIVSDDGKDKLELDFEYDEDQEDPADDYVKDYVTKTYGAKATFRKK